MSEKRHLVKVVIVGEEYSIRSDASPDHTRAVAHYVDHLLAQITPAGGRDLRDVHVLQLIGVIADQVLEGSVDTADTAVKIDGQ